MNKRVVLIGAAAVIGMCICACVAIAGFAAIGGLGMTQPAADVGEKFMQSLKAADYATAYALCHPALQREIGSSQNLKEMVESGQAQPRAWNFTARSIENDQGHLEGTVTMQGGAGTVTLDLAQSGGEWKVIAFNLQPD